MARERNSDETSKSADITAGPDCTARTAASSSTSYGTTSPRDGLSHCPPPVTRGVTGGRMSTCHTIWMATTFGGWFGKVMSCQRSIFTESPLAS